MTLRSKSHKGHYSMQHTALWSCTHIPNIIDLSGKTKKLWSGQASLRRSRSGSERKNQTKTMSPFVRRGDINKVALFLFASHSFLANNLHFIVKLIDKAIVNYVKIHKNERKRLYLRERPFNLKGGGYGFFLKKIF